MQEPAAGAAAFAVDPKQRTVDITRHVVIARGIGAIPPAALDAFGTPEKLQPATAPGPPGTLRQLLRGLQQPGGAAHRQRRWRRANYLLEHGFSHAPGAF